jgi:hypothetical protein
VNDVVVMARNNELSHEDYPVSSHYTGEEAFQLWFYILSTKLG